MLVGYPPFGSDNPEHTIQKIHHWRKTLRIPDEPKLAPESKDIIRRLMCDAPNRLGVNGIDEIKNHPFFKGIDWKNLRNTKAAFIPTLKNDYDVSRFDEFEEE